MFFLVSKIIGLFLEPTNVVAFALLAGLLLTFTRFARLGRRITAGVTIVFLVMCFSPLSALMLRVLEDRFPHPGPDLSAPTGIIVLGGSINEDLSIARGEITIDQAAARLTAAVALARRFPQARLVFTGGSGNLRQTAHAEAEGVKRLWLSLGVPEARMTFESKSRNTYENAVMTRDLIGPKPGEDWLLVTSAWHMPRSVGIFRKAGFQVTAFPVDYRTFGDARDWRPPFNAVLSLDRLDTASHEWTGLLAYWITGKTDALFPKP